MSSRRAVEWLIRSVLMLGLLSLAGATGGAQSLFGTISGLVADDQGGALPGADVILTDQSSRAVQRTTTNAEGVFVFAAVPAGTYTIKVELQNFNSWEATDIGLRLGERRSVTGIRLNRDDLSIQVRDTRDNLRSFLMENVREIRFDKPSLMPPYGTVLNKKEIDDVVSYLSSLRGVQ